MNFGLFLQKDLILFIFAVLFGPIGTTLCIGIFLRLHILVLVLVITCFASAADSFFYSIDFFHSFGKLLYIYLTISYLPSRSRYFRSFSILHTCLGIGLLCGICVGSQSIRLQILYVFMQVVSSSLEQQYRFFI